MEKEHFVEDRIRPWEQIARFLLYKAYMMVNEFKCVGSIIFLKGNIYVCVRLAAFISLVKKKTPLLTLTFWFFPVISRLHFIFIVCYDVWPVENF